VSRAIKNGGSITQSHSEIKCSHLVKLMVQIDFNLKSTTQANERAKLFDVIQALCLNQGKHVSSHPFFFSFRIVSIHTKTKLHLLLCRSLKLEASVVKVVQVWKC